MKRYLAHLHRRGFTLVELVVVIAIMAILAGTVTSAVIGVAKSVKDNNNKDAVRNYFAMAKAALDQINSGVSIYSNGTFTTTADIATLMRRTTGSEPKMVYRVEDTQNAEKNRPFPTDDAGYYVFVRFADPALTYPVTSSSMVDDANRKFFVDAVYYVSDKVCYGVSRSSVEVSVTR